MKLVIIAISLLILSNSLRAHDAAGLLSAEIPHGFCCDGGTTDAGWYAAVMLIEQPDEPFRSQAASSDYERAADVVRNWQSHFVAQPRRLVLVTEQNPAEQVEIAKADRIFGPACPPAPTKQIAVAWTQKTGDAWSLMLYLGGHTTNLYTGDTLLTNPAIAIGRDGPSWPVRPTPVGVAGSCCLKVVANGR